MQTYTHCPAPPHPQSTMAKPHVSVGINRSAQSSSHPALKSFPEVVLQKPAAEEDKRAAIPQAQCLLSSTQISLCCPLLLLHSPLIPTFLPSLIISIPFFSSASHAFLPYYLSPSFPLAPSYNSPFCASLSCSPLPFRVHPFLHLSPSSRCFFFIQTSVMNEARGPSSPVRD